MATTTEEARQSGDRYLVRRAFFDDRNEIYYALWQYGTLAMVVAPILSAHGETTRQRYPLQTTAASY